MNLSVSSTPHTPRVKKLDVAFVTDRLADWERARARAEQWIREEPDKRLQTKTSMLKEAWRSIALNQFALGYPPDRVRQSFAEAAAAYLKVFELRGTEGVLVVWTADPSKAGTKDFSETNSNDCLEGICLALIAREKAIAEKLAELMWDPPRADYIGPRSEVCTHNQQRLAYAVKGLLQKHPDEVEKELKGIFCRKGEERIAAMSKMVQGLAKKSDGIFNEGLLELLFWHKKEAKNPINNTDPRMYFCVPAVGLSILAVQQGLIKESELPHDEYLPLELISEESLARAVDT